MPKSNDALLVLNAGASSIKLAIFAVRAGELKVAIREEVEGCTPRRGSRRITRQDALSLRGGGATRHWVTVEYLSHFRDLDLADAVCVGMYLQTFMLAPRGAGDRHVRGGLGDGVSDFHRTTRTFTPI